MTTLLLLAEEEYVNVTPTLLKFTAKFFIVFAVIAIVGVLTPWMAKKVDAMREKSAARTKKYTEDPRAKEVRSIYDIAPPEKPTEEPPQASEPSDTGEAK